MIWRSILKTIAVLVTTAVGLAVLAVIAIAGYVIYHLVVPEKMDITGRVTNSTGQPVKGIEVRAVPLPLNDPFSDSDMKPQDAEHTVIFNEDGRYCFEGLVASVGVKEGRCMQGYHIVARSGERSSTVIRGCKHPDDRSSVITLDDLVVEQGGSAVGEGGS